MVMRAIQTYGVTDGPLPVGPPLFRFGDPDEAIRSLGAVGFTDVWSVVLPLVWRPPRPESLPAGCGVAIARSRSQAGIDAPINLVAS
jgi:hypothetical protein